MTINESHIIFYFLPKDEKKAENFFSVYEPIMADFSIMEYPTNLKDPKDRICRFCRNSYPKVTFDKKAHTIPEFLGNSHSISDFECDQCNKHFGKLENQLRNFIGPAVTLNRTAGKKKIPNSPSHDNSLIAKKVDFFGAKNAIEFGSVENIPGKFTYDEKTGKHSTQFTTQPFVPYDVYKSLLKMAMGLLPEADITTYNLAFELLQDIKNTKFKNNEFFSLYIYNLSSLFSYTGIFLFKRKDPDSTAPPLCFALCYGQLIYFIYIPLSFEYQKKVLGKTVSFPLLPLILPFSDINELEGFFSTFEIEKLASIISTSRVLNVSIIPENKNERMVALDLNSREELPEAKLEPNKAVKFIITDDKNFSKPIKNKLPDMIDPKIKEFITENSDDKVQSIYQKLYDKQKELNLKNNKLLIYLLLTVLFYFISKSAVTSINLAIFSIKDFKIIEMLIPSVFAYISFERTILIKHSTQNIKLLKAINHKFYKFPSTENKKRTYNFFSNMILPYSVGVEIENVISHDKKYRWVNLVLILPLLLAIILPLWFLFISLKNVFVNYSNHWIGIASIAFSIWMTIVIMFIYFKPTEFDKDILTPDATKPLE